MTDVQRILSLLAADNAVIARLVDMHAYLGPPGEVRVFVVDAAAVERGPLGGQLAQLGVGSMTSDDSARRLFALPRHEAQRLAACLPVDEPLPADFVSKCGAQLRPDVLRAVVVLGKLGMTTDAPMTKIRTAARTASAHAAVVAAMNTVRPLDSAGLAIPPAAGVASLLPRSTSRPSDFLLGVSPLGVTPF